MSGARCIFALYFLMLFLNLQDVRTMNVRRLRIITKEDVCKETNKTIKVLKSLPENYTVSREQMQKNVCDNLPKCNGEQLIYHCVRHKAYLVEVCAPRRLITGSYCPVFDNGIGRVIEDFSRPCSECPFKYQSADALKYSSCMNIGKMQISSPKSNTATSTHDQLLKMFGIDGSPCCDATRCKRTTEGCTKDKSTSNVMKPNENHPKSGVKKSTFSWIYITLPASILCISLLSTIVFALYLNRKRRTSRAIEKDKKEMDCNTSADQKIRNATMKPLLSIA